MQREHQGFCLPHCAVPHGWSCGSFGPKSDVLTLAVLSGTALLGELLEAFLKALQLGAPEWFVFLELLCTEQLRLQHRASHGEKQLLAQLWVMQSTHCLPCGILFCIPVGLVACRKEPWLYQGEKSCSPPIGRCIPLVL